MQYWKTYRHFQPIRCHLIWYRWVLAFPVSLDFLFPHKNAVIFYARSARRRNGKLRDLPGALLGLRAPPCMAALILNYHRCRQLAPFAFQGSPVFLRLLSSIILEAQWSFDAKRGRQTEQLFASPSALTHAASALHTTLLFFPRQPEKKKWYCRIIPAPRGLEQSIIQHCQLMARFVYVMIYWIRIFPLLISPVKFIEFLTNGLTGHGVTGTLTHTLQIVFKVFVCSSYVPKKKCNRWIWH